MQINGKLRDTLELPVGLDQSAILAAARASEKVARHLEGKAVVKEIYIPGKLLNLVVK